MEEEYGNFAEIVWNELDPERTGKVGYITIKEFVKKYNCNLSKDLFKSKILLFVY